ncbi:MAG: phosphoribosylanthranilate isomerase [Pseudopedobacter saltans]|uniref:N-(5'-phosphoribosyl)anthranilate isomerase n=1 Tax=Pseudopedobacter saltans TaxID=151895 RepID=A0A2W5GL22_9SPHI|nr:MAG: phosphoribosylanthranilate isomerase [Pseudopedobacter saltans]
MKIKVCGMTQIKQVEALEKMGVHYAGFIFYSKSPRYVLAHLSKSDIKKIGGNIKKVGVFVNEPLDSLLEIIDSAGLDIVQLHGDETPEYCSTVRKKVKVVKAFQVKSLDGLLENIRQYDAFVDMFLFDTPSIQYGGTGEKFDWNTIKDILVGKPFFLSGGISPDDFEQIEKFGLLPIANDLDALDLNSRFEKSPGIKDLELLESFFNKL